MGEKTNALVSFTSVSGAQDWSFVLNKEGPGVGQDMNPSGQSGLRIKYLPSLWHFPNAIMLKVSSGIFDWE